MTVRVRRAPAVTTYEGWRWPSFDAGADAMRTLAQAGLLPTVIRLSDESETAINLADPTSIGGAEDPGCLMITGYEGTAEQVDAGAPPSRRSLDRPRRHRAGRGARRDVGARPLRRALPPRRAARPRRPRRDPRDRHLLVQPPAAVRRRGPRCRPRSARARWCSATSRTSTRPVLALLHRRRPPGRRPAGAVAGRQGRRQRGDGRRRRDHHPPPRRRHRPPAVARAARSARSACGCCAR